MSRIQRTCSSKQNHVLIKKWIRDLNKPFYKEVIEMPTNS